MTVQTTISALPEGPQRSNPAQFDDKADAFVKGLEDLPPELNAFANEVNQTQTEVNQKVDQGVQSVNASKTAAAASATRASEWADSAQQIDGSHHSAKAWAVGDTPAGSAKHHAEQAKGHKDAAQTALQAAQTVAAAVQSSSGLPAIAGKAGLSLKVNSASNGVEWAETNLSGRVPVGGALLADFDNDIYTADDGAKYTRMGVWVPYEGAINSAVGGLPNVVKTPFTQRVTGGNRSIRAVAHNGSTFVAVGQSGDAWTSDDGVTWNANHTGVSSNLNAIVWHNGLWVAVGDGGSVMTSPDGENWTARSSNTSASFYGLATANGVLVAVGSGGTIVTSTNGTSWTTRSSGKTTHLRDVTHNGSFFAVVGDASTFLTSTNGTSWSAGSINSGNYRGITAVDSKLIAVGAGGFIAHSANGGGTWTPTYAGARNGTGWNALYLDHEGVFVAGNNVIVVSQNGQVLTSPVTDLATWTTQVTGVTSLMRGGVSGAGRAYVVGDNGTILDADHSLSPARIKTGDFTPISGLSAFMRYV